MPSIKTVSKTLRDLPKKDVVGRDDGWASKAHKLRFWVGDD